MIINNIFKFLISRELWTGVVASVIASIICSMFNNISIVDEQLFSYDFIKEVLYQPVPLYVLLVAVLVLSFVIFIIRAIRKPKFLNDTTMKMGDFIWHWRWSYDKKEKRFDMVDFLPLCPKCGKELRVGMGEHLHKCVNGHQYNIQNYFGLKSQIKSDIRSKYPNEAEKIAVNFLFG